MLSLSPMPPTAMKLRLHSMWGPWTQPATPLPGLPCFEEGWCGEMLQCNQMLLLLPHEAKTWTNRCISYKPQTFLFLIYLLPNRLRGDIIRFHVSNKREGVKSRNPQGLLLFALVSEYALPLRIISSWISCQAIQGFRFPFLVFIHPYLEQKWNAHQLTVVLHLPTHLY